MIDIDRLKLRAEMSITREGSLFVEYAIHDAVLEVQALFSLKHRQIQLNRKSRALDFVSHIQNQVMLAMARKLEARLFVVFHGDNESPPFEIHEVNTKNGSTIRRADISGNTQAAWESAWKELGLL